MKNIKRPLTFYHEFRIPNNSFFLEGGSERKHLFLSSPSRMGNHALISMLDSHPQLPTIPGEDSFLTWAFVKGNQDISNFINDVKDIDYIEKMSSDSCSTNKWFEHKKAFIGGCLPDIYNGVQYDYRKKEENSLHRIPERDSCIDFQGVTLDVDYDGYHQVFENHQETIEHSTKLIEIFEIYLQAYHRLLGTNKESCIDYTYACSGMRVQSLWALKNIANMKLIVSIRSFDSYAPSMIKSFYKTSEIRTEYLKEAWEQWHHKVVDYLYLKLSYPDQVLLVDFDDIISDSKFVATSICKFLDIEYHDCMLEATVNGVKVKGNSSLSRKNEESGAFYKTPGKKLDAKHIPEDYHPIWGMFNEMKSLLSG